MGLLNVDFYLKINAGVQLCHLAMGKFIEKKSVTEPNHELQNMHVEESYYKPISIFQYANEIIKWRTRHLQMRN